MRSECPEAVRAIFEALIAPWGDTLLPDAPAWPSDITDDHTPFEFSVVFGSSSPELRILVEAQGTSPTLAATMEAGRELNRALALRGADLSRLAQVEDLFFPERPEGRFALWHAAALVEGREPAFRVYLNPQVNGKSLAHATVEEALGRLGFAGAWSFVAEAARRAPPTDEIRYFSLDLAADARARAKVYIYHHQATTADLERAASLASSYVPGAATEFYEAIAGSINPVQATAPATCLAFVEGQAAPTSSTLHVPIRFLADNDRVARQGLRAYFIKKGIPVDAYDRVVDAAARRPLASGSGLHTYASLRSEPRGPRVTVYVATEAFVVAPVSSRGPASRARPPEEIVTGYERDSIAYHPFFQRMRREPVDMGLMWKLLVNVREGIVKHFSRRLAHVVAGADDVRIRSILAKQLNDELGDGDASRAHYLLFDHLIDGLEPFRPAVVPDDLLGPGRAWSRRLEELYLKGSNHEGIGAAIVIEIVGKQADCFMGDEFRRQSAVSAESLEWMNLHEVLEQEHSNESMEIAHLVPHEGQALEAVWRGARECGASCWAFLDAMYRVCYGAPSEPRP